MLCLPYGPSGCTNTDHWHIGTGTGGKLDTLMAQGCNAHKVHALLTILASEDVNALLSDQYSAQYVAYYTPRYWAPMVEATIHAIYDPADDGHLCLNFNDLKCRTCGRWVSKVLEPAHWENLCGTCMEHKDDGSCECCQTCGYSPCECCPICQDGPMWDCDCCQACEQTGGNCECETCRECGYKEQECQCGSYSGHSFGSSTRAPWLDRGNDPLDYTLPRISECNNDAIDPLQAAADFYLLDAIKNLVRFADAEGGDQERMAAERANLIRSDSMLSALVQSAERSYRALVDHLAPSFLAYAVPAVGGELRYHRCAGKALKASSRDQAWDKFVAVVEQYGPETLFEADTLFLEFGTGAYGGKKWGDAAKVVGQYLKGNMPAWLFVDRVFTLQHNGGCFLNKVSWKKRNGLKWGLSKMVHVLNAHAGKNEHGDEVPTDWDLLCRIASPEVAAMFRMSERHITRAVRRYGAVLVPFPTKKRYASHSYDD